MFESKLETVYRNGHISVERVVETLVNYCGSPVIRYTPGLIQVRTAGFNPLTILPILQDNTPDWVEFSLKNGYIILRDRIKVAAVPIVDWISLENPSE